MKRYFLISYFCNENNGTKANGTLTMSSEKFPSSSFIKSTIKNEFDIKELVVLNIFEFNSKEDYEEFEK